MPPNAISMHFPFLEGDSSQADAALSSTFAIASVGIATLKMLETLLPAAAGEVERESRQLANHFSVISSYIECSGPPPARVAEALSGVIMGMQFQDRNTQIMDNVACILERYRTMLEDVCTNIEAMRDGDVSTGHNVTLAVEDILSSIRLSEIRTRYMEALAKAKVHHGGGGDQVFEVQPTDDIELF